MAVSCAGNGGSDNTTTAAPSVNNSGDTAGGETAGVQEEDLKESYKFPDGADYGGYNMRILVQDCTGWAMSDMWTEEENGDPINDAIYTRNARVEAGLNVQITEFQGDAESTARRSIQAASDDYDIIFTFSSAAGNLATQGMYHNLYNVPGLELDKPWWNQNAHQSAELLGKLYFTTSDANIVTNDAVWIVYFNKKILQNHQMADPYQLVREGKWTMDVFYGMAKDAAIDLDGDGIFTVSDQWGISTHDQGFLAFFICQEQQLIKLNEDNEPYMVMPDDRFVNAFTKANRLMDAAGGLYLHAQGNYPGKTGELDHATKTFMHDMSLFCTEVLSHARAFREMTADFGLLPHPKYDENQQNYYTFMIDTVPAFGIPITADPERSGIFIEAMTGVSADTIMPAYYNISLQGKFTRDEESIEMLDIIRDGRVFDLSVLYNWAGYYSAIITEGVKVASAANPLTVFERLEGRVTTAIETTLEKYLEFD
jgi:hypothetical protein